MKTSVARKQLANSLKILRMLKHPYVLVTTGKLTTVFTVSEYDFTVERRTDNLAPDPIPGEAVVNLKQLSDCIAKSKAAFVTLELVYSRLIVSWMDDRPQSVSLPVMFEHEYTIFHYPLMQGPVVSLLPSHLRRAMEFALPCVTEESTASKWSTGYVLFDCKWHKPTTIVATDTKRMTVVPIYTIQSGMTENLLVPPMALRLALACIAADASRSDDNDSGEVYFLELDDELTIKYRNGSICCKGGVGHFPNYKTIARLAGGVTVNAEVSDFQTMVNTVWNHKRAPGQHLEFVISMGAITLSTTDKTDVSYSATCPVSGHDGTLEFRSSYDGWYLAQTMVKDMSHYQTVSIRVGQHSRDPLRLEFDGSVIAIVLPIVVPPTNGPPTL